MNDFDADNLHYTTLGCEKENDLIMLVLMSISGRQKTPLSSSLEDSL